MTGLPVWVIFEIILKITANLWEVSAAGPTQCCQEFAELCAVERAVDLILV